MKHSNFAQLTLAGLFVIGSVFGPVLAAGKCKSGSSQFDLSCAYDPKPASDDFALPMPSISGLGEIKMIFRKVKVPGSEFWGNPERLVRVGDAREKSDSVFEGVQNLPISGVFYDSQEDHWFYYLGKYEVTIAQYVAVMGDGDEKEGLARFYKASDDNKLISKLKKSKSKISKYRVLAQPLAWTSWHEFQAFIHQYNMWCYANEACLAKLPRLPKKDWKEQVNKDHDVPGFFRLPTELEWEYAARGGYQALTTEKEGSPLFEKSLPFPENKLEKYAWTRPHSKKGVTRIGRWQDTYGFYDLFGNVQELTNHFFVAEIIQGKVGALSARGGSFQDHARTIRSSFRREIEIYKPKEDRTGKITEVIESRSPTTGIRLAIGSLVSPSPRFHEAIEKEYDNYEETFRKKTAAGKSTDDTLVQGADDLKKAYQSIEALKKRDKDWSEKLADLTTKPKREHDSEELKEARSAIESLKTRYTDSSREISMLQKSLVSADKKIQEGIREVCSYMTEVALFRLTSGGYSYAISRNYKKFLDRNQEESAVSRVMKNRIREVKQKLAEVERAYEDHFSQYVKTVRKLGGYPKDYINEAIERLHGEKSADKRSVRFIKLMKQQIDQATSGVREPKLWIGQAKELALQVYVK